MPWGLTPTSHRWELSRRSSRWMSFHFQQFLNNLSRTCKWRTMILASSWASTTRSICWRNSEIKALILIQQTEGCIAWLKRLSKLNFRQERRNIFNSITLRCSIRWTNNLDLKCYNKNKFKRNPCLRWKRSRSQRKSLQKSRKQMPGSQNICNSGFSIPKLQLISHKVFPKLDFKTEF